MNTIQSALTTKQQNSPANNALQHQIKQQPSASFSQTLKTELKSNHPLTVPAEVKNQGINIKSPRPTTSEIPTSESSSDTDEEYSEAKYAVKMGLYNYMIEQREKELRTKAEQQVLEEQGLTKETMAALPKEEHDDISQLIEERYQTLRKTLIEEMIAQLKQQLQNALQNTPEQGQPALPQVVFSMPPA